MTQSTDTITRSIRFPLPMMADIKARAEANKRSVQDEVIFLLEQVLDSQTPPSGNATSAPPSPPNVSEKNQAADHLLTMGSNMITTALELLKSGKNTLAGLA